MADPKPTYSYLVSQLKQRFPALAYLHVIDPRVDTNWFDKEPDQVSSTESNDFLRDIWAPKPFIRAGGFNRESGIEEAEKGDLIAYGRWYMANVRRIFSLSELIADYVTSLTCQRAF